MDTKGPLKLPSDGKNFAYVIVDHSNKYISTVTTPKNAYHAVHSITHLWISKFDPTQNVISDRRPEYLNSELTTCCTMFKIRHPTRNSHARWTNGRVKVQNKSLGTYLDCLFFQYSWKLVFCSTFLAFAHKIQRLSHLHISTFEVVFHTQTRIPLKFQLNLPRKNYLQRIAQYHSVLWPLSQYQLTDINPLFQSIMFKPISYWYLSYETS